jgi:hypothetical protein
MLLSNLLWKYCNLLCSFLEPIGNVGFLDRLPVQPHRVILGQ